MITPQDTLVTEAGFAALVARARKKKVKVKGQRQGQGRIRKSSRADQATADTEQIELIADRKEADELESAITDVVVVTPGDVQDHVTEGSFVTLCIECDGDKPNQQSTWLLYQSPISMVESHHGVMGPSSDIGRAVLGQLVGKELRVSTRTNGDRSVTIVRSQRLLEVTKSKVEL